MTPIEKWPAVRPALLVTAMLMWGFLWRAANRKCIPPRSTLGQQTKWQRGLRRRQRRIGRLSANHMQRAVLIPLGPFPRSLARNSRALRAPSILAGLLGRSSERDRLGATVRT
jgi:hypothetical protein